MARKRFPKAKYVRQLENLYTDLGEWRESYLMAAKHYARPPRDAVLDDRAAVLGHAQHELHKLIYTLSEMPRLS